LAVTPEACQSFQEISLASGLSEEAQWAHLVVLALDVLPTGDIHPEGKVR